jgi:peptide/nickel transport system permease protein
VFTARSPDTGTPALRLSPPSLAHPFGTDYLGRDLCARVVYGTSLSLRASLVAVLLALVVGSLVGLLAGYLGGVLDEALMRLTDVLLAIPGLLLSLAVVTAFGFGTVQVSVAVGVAGVPSLARAMRVEVLRVRGSSYVEAARMVGQRWPAVLLRHVLPHATGPVAALAALEFGAAVLAVSALGFLGFGPPPPTPEWGALVADGRSYLATAWWLTTLPGLVVAVVVLAANRLARALEPTQERS